MSDPLAPRVGGVLSADIAVPDHERTVRFYSRVLTTGETPLWREDLMNRDGVPVIGLGPRSPESADLPLQWMPHIQVADVASSVERALELGGRELMHAKGDDGSSQWAVLGDPQGAAFGIIPVVSADAIPEAEGSTSSDASSDDASSDDQSGRAGHIAWFDLTVEEAATTRDFYRQVVGWTVQDAGMKDGDEEYVDFVLCGGDGEPVGGICHARGVNQELPPVWLLYLPVGDLAESLQRVRAEGGRVVKTTPGADGAPAYGVIQDTVGAHVVLAQA